jgi:hypothetical protein
MTNCPYGKIFLPKGSAFDQNSGLRVSIQDNSNNIVANFIHTQNSYLESGEKFTTVTELIDTNISPKKIILYCNSSLVIDNMIKLVIKNKNTKKIISSKYIGQLNQRTTLQFIEFSSPLTINLNNDAIILEIYSINWQDTEPCCDQLPSQIIISDVPREVGGSRFLCVPLEQYYVLPTTTTTVAPEPFLIDFITQPYGRTVNLNTYTTFSFSAISINDIDFSYWFEVSKDNGNSWSKVSKLSTGKSRQNHTLLVQASSEKNNYKYRALIVEPKIVQSSIGTLNIIFPTTTTTTPEPCVAVTTTTTTTTTESPYYEYYIESQQDIEEDTDL